MNEGAVHDVLGRVLELTHLRGRIYCHSSARAPWGLCVDASADAVFHLITAGTCWLFLGEQRVALGPGDVVLLPRGSAHALADHARSRRIPLAAWLAARGTVDRRMRLGDGQGAETLVLCGVYAFDVPGARHPALRVLPELVHIPAKKTRGRPELAETIAGLTREHDRADLGQSLVVSRLLDVLFVQLLRAWVDDQPAGGAGWLGALRDSLIAAALSLLHEDLAAPWDVATLAAKLGTSRPTLARRFVAEVGLSPLAYLTQARMHEAARLVRETDRSLTEIAEAVGYTSVSAFNRAFHREHGMPPGAFRKQGAAHDRREAGDDAPAAPSLIE
ncbi:cupin domain-containing protein [Sorangium sp. So ce1078]|uniref:cupin domain-containing protein n=1 Tax=Sorangium sp. So ce1078 TaxID=3133329 RepID=UPI003F5E2679